MWEDVLCKVKASYVLSTNVGPWKHKSLQTSCRRLCPDAEQIPLGHLYWFYMLTLTSVFFVFCTLTFGILPPFISQSSPYSLSDGQRRFKAQLLFLRSDKLWDIIYAAELPMGSGLDGDVTWHCTLAWCVLFPVYFSHSLNSLSSENFLNKSLIHVSSPQVCSGELKTR